jgi:hypothetical protein
MVPRSAVMRLRLTDNVAAPSEGGDRPFVAHLDRDLVDDGVLIAPGGSTVYGRLAAVEGGPLQLELTEVEVEGARRPLTCAGAGGEVAGGVSVRLLDGKMLVTRGDVVSLGPNLPLISGAILDQNLDVTRQLVRTNRRAIVDAAMELSLEESRAFWPVYREYEVDLLEVNDRMAEVVEAYLAQGQTLSEEAAEAMLDEVLAIQWARLELSQRCARKLGRTLTPQRVLRFLQVEQRLDIAIRSELANQIPLVE